MQLTHSNSAFLLSHLIDILVIKITVWLYHNNWHRVRIFLFTVILTIDIRFYFTNQTPNVRYFMGEANNKTDKTGKNYCIWTINEFCLFRIPLPIPKHACNLYIFDICLHHLFILLLPNGYRSIQHKIVHSQITLDLTDTRRI